MLTSQARVEELRGHIARALDNGVTRDELVELITHLAFYAGWPTAMSAMRAAQEVFASADERDTAMKEESRR